MNATLAVVPLSAIWSIPGIAVAQKAAVPKPPDKLALGVEEVRQLLLLMDTDKSGKISKQEWMKFIEAEFDRLDKNKNGELDVKEISQSRLRVSRPIDVGK
jgi:EF hand domain-containing protein